MRMPWVQGSDSSLGVLLLHPHTLVMWSTEEESCHQSVPGPSEQGRSTGGSGSWPTFSLSQHLKVSSWSATAHWLTQWCLLPQCSGPNETWNFRGIVSSFKILQRTSKGKKKGFADWIKRSPPYPSENAEGNLITRLSSRLQHSRNKISGKHMIICSFTKYRATLSQCKPLTLTLQVMHV